MFCNHHHTSSDTYVITNINKTVINKNNNNIEDDIFNKSARLSWNKPARHFIQSNIENKHSVVCLMTAVGCLGGGWWGGGV